MRILSLLLCGFLAAGALAAPAVVTESTFKDAGGIDRAAITVVPPEGVATRGGILFLHWLGGPPKNDRTEFLEDAQKLGEQGFASFLIDMPWAERGWYRNRQLDNDAAMSATVVKSIGLALERLQTLLPPKSRIALVGHDFGAMYGLIAAGRDERIGAAVIIAATPRFADWFLLGREMSDDAKRSYLATIESLDAPQHLAKRSNMPVLFQFARNDDYIPEARAKELVDAARGPKETRWYETTHRMDHPDASRDRIQWLTRWVSEK